MRLRPPTLNRPLLALCGALLLGGTPGEVAAAPPAAVEISADRLDIDHPHRRARFSGHVRAVVGELRVSCDELTAGYDDLGNLTRLEASGAVGVEHGDLAAQAGHALFLAPANRIELSGQPSLVRAGNRLTGRRIVVELATGRVTVEAARGTFRLPAAAGAP